MSAIPSERRTQALALLEWLEPGAPKRVAENLDGFHDDTTGITREEIVEVVLQVAVYAGIPASMNAITAAKSAFTSV
ncbi:hypothetical protein BTW10_07940 [Chromohalobacter japonicus]|uniref:Carboxymuconolactone decarboxylase-like domain-containing protein n=2 Tax=Chromohalobacter TaxID=42054 RepID=A0A1Q8TDQ6_9GAMM|nr:MULTISPECIES: carboxymuconolactone decarboxylase family protein [Chromohalobacter]MCT8467829.1 carboxymuconolactone decarboxylase family protein [Chromohalobacter canadensis]MCT8470422.1 carboxymuconolactone decarboxylase family protein [Chromohalobacter canadensis]MCT8498326.1 carboxymuconolactone decarboxylase family protein [Chromohalobacter canadensis]OLO11768.1 hypothetical protein BTW10_07940 [Chromohalobacter japonicus]SOC58298.1 4-carboxymuconolactone decarboxylase [Chromohalobacter